MLLNPVSACVILLLASAISIYAKPVERDTPSPPADNHTSGLEYDRYLRQVVEVLEKDPAFLAKLQNASQEEIKSGKIARYLEMVNHTVRTALDEAKRVELARLQQQFHQKRLQAMREGHRGNVQHMQIPGHIDVHNPHTFEVKDLENLIKKTTSDLEELDKQRKEEFKEYEMEKEYEKREHLNKLSEDERRKEEARLEELKKKHAEHPKVHDPGSKDQLEEVWDKVDHLEEQQFNPRTFFFKHDIDGDMEWSVDEVDAILQLELDKVYDARNSPEEDDPIERQEEMNRMREHVYQQIDKDKNWRISYQEFIDYTGRDGNNPEFEKDEGWKTVDEEPVFTNEDYEKFLESQHAQPGVIHPPQDLQFQSEQHIQQNLNQQHHQQAPPGQPQQYQPPPQGQQQQPTHGQQQYQPPPQGQQQYQPPPQVQQQPAQGQKQYQPPPHVQQQPAQGQQQYQPSPQGQQQYQPPPQGQQQYQPPPQGQQQYQTQQQGQQQYQPPPQGQQQYQPPPQGQQQYQPPPSQGQQQPPQGQQQYQPPPQGQQQPPQGQQQPPQGQQQPPQGQQYQLPQGQH